MMGWQPRLQRNLQRRRLGGVCAGIADFLGIGPTPVRLLFLLSIFVSFSLTFWIYLALWLILPAKPHVPIPDVSRPLRRELNGLEKQVRKAHRLLDPEWADRIQETFDAIKILAPGLEKGASLAGQRNDLREKCLQAFPDLLQRLLKLPSGLTAGSAAREQLVAQLMALSESLRQASEDALRQGIDEAWNKLDVSSPQWEEWKDQLTSLQSRLQDRVGGETLAVLQRIEEKLAFLATRSDTETAAFEFDLDPFQVNKIALEYLPDAVEQYLKLPPSLARSEPLPGGKTAEQALHDQLGLLDQALLDLSRSLYERNAGGLMIHGHFLREKFAEQSFRLPE